MRQFAIRSYKSVEHRWWFQPHPPPPLGTRITVPRFLVPFTRKRRGDLRPFVRYAQILNDLSEEEWSDLEMPTPNASLCRPNTQLADMESPHYPLQDDTAPTENVQSQGDGVDAVCGEVPNDLSGRTFPRPDNSKVPQSLRSSPTDPPSPSSQPLSPSHLLDPLDTNSQLIQMSRDFGPFYSPINCNKWTDGFSCTGFSRTVDLDWLDLCAVGADPTVILGPSKHHSPVRMRHQSF